MYKLSHSSKNFFKIPYQSLNAEREIEQGMRLSYFQFTGLNEGESFLISNHLTSDHFQQCRL